MIRKIGKAILLSMGILLVTSALPTRSFATEVVPMEMVENADWVTESEVLTADENIQTGTIGTNNGIQWTYDKSTKTLTITGEDSGVQGSVGAGGLHYSVFYDICSDVRNIVVRDCKIIGSAHALFGSFQSVQYITIENFDTSQITDMSYMFFFCRNLKEVDVSGFDTSQVTDMSNMFYECMSLTELDVSGFDTSQVTDMSGMFACWILNKLDVSGFNTSQVTDMSSMFSGVDVTTLDIGGFDTSKVTNMSEMFSGCINVEQLDVSKFDTSKVTDMSYMFSNCKNVKELDVSRFDTSKVLNMCGMFYECNNVLKVDVSNFDTAKVNNMARMFWGCSNLTELDVRGFDTANVEEMSSMFKECSGLTELDVSGFDTAKVRWMSSMFEDCNKLTALDVTGFNTSQVIGISSMFSGCYSLKELDVSSFDTSNVTGMYKVFCLCSGLKELDVSNFDTSKVEQMTGMFEYCRNLEKLDVSGFDTSNVHDMSSMFGSCSSIKELDLSNFDTTKVTIMDFMFQNCYGLVSLNISNFNTSKVTNMSSMFSDCRSLEELDVKHFDTSKVVNMYGMFRECKSLTVLDLSSFDVSKASQISNMLESCAGLTTIITPAIMLEGQSITLPGNFSDAQQNIITEITSAACNTTLTRVVRNVVIEADHQKVTIGNPLQLFVNLEGTKQDASANNSFTWSVDSEEVAKVSETGVVTGVGVGTAVITCVNKENGAEKASFTITIEVPFTDIKVTDWQYPYVVYAYENNLMSGKGEGKFDMNGKLTRSEFVTVLYSYAGKPEVTYVQDFTDVAESDWFALPVVWAKQNGVTAGIGDGSFGVSNNITREQLVVMLYQFAKKQGMSIGELTADLSAYADEGAVSDWATEALTWAVQNGIISGKSGDGVISLDPKGNTTRGECATMMMRYAELTK